jgi:hypothetical protein
VSSNCSKKNLRITKHYPPLAPTSQMTQSKTIFTPMLHGIIRSKERRMKRVIEGVNMICYSRRRRRTISVTQFMSL